MGWENKSLFKWSRSHDRYGRHAHIWSWTILFSGTKRPMTLKVGMQHRVFKYYQDCSNAPGLTLAYFAPRSNLVPYAIVWGKGKTIDFSETIVVYDIKVGRFSLLNEYMKLYEYQSSRSFIDLGPNLSDSIYLNFFSSITTTPIEAKFHVEPPWDGGGGVEGGRKLIHMVQFTWPKWPPCPYMVKHFEADDLETWYAASSTRVLPSNVQMILLGWPWPILRQVKFVPLCFVLEKVKTMDVSETNVVYDITAGRCSQLNCVHEALWVPDVKVIHWPWSRSLRFNICKLLFPNNPWSSALRWAIQDQWSSGFNDLLYLVNKKRPQKLRCPSCKSSSIVIELLWSRSNCLLSRLKSIKCRINDHTWSKHVDFYL